MRRLAFLLFTIIPGFTANGQNLCDIPINEDRILKNTNLDFFLKRLKTDSFSTGYDKRKIPDYIRNKLYCLLDTLANPDEDWQEGDVVFEELPWRKLNFFSVNSRRDVFVIAYYHGGIGVNTRIIMMSLTDGGIIVDGQKNVADVWIGQTFFEGKTLPDLIKFIEQNRYKHFGLNTNAVIY